MDNQDQYNQQSNNGYNGYQQPNNGYQQPNNGYQQPNNGYQQYNNNYQQYNNGYGYQQYNNGYQSSYNTGAPIRPRSVVLYIVLSILTCGLFSLVWLVLLADDMNAVAQDGNTTGGGMVLLLSIITCSIYLFIWSYKQGERVDRWKGSNNSTGIIYLLLSLFGLNLVAMALMQDELNKLA